jgi:hypothetical protein
MVPKTPRFWPEMNMRRGFLVWWPRNPLSNLAAPDGAAGEPFGVLDDASERVPT